MPIIHNFTVPKGGPGALVFPPTQATTATTEKEVSLPLSSSSFFFIAFLASEDPQTGKPWCPDVVAALPILRASFTGAGKPAVGFVEVGSREEWKDPKNVFRTAWDVKCVPALVKFEKGSKGEVREVGRLLEGEILDGEKLGAFLSA